MRISGGGPEHILRDAAELRERAIAKAGLEQNQPVDTLSRQDIDSFNRDQLTAYMKTDPAFPVGPGTNLALGQLERAEEASSLRTKLWAAAGVGGALLAAAALSPVAGVALAVGGGTLLAGAAGRGALHFLRAHVVGGTETGFGEIAGLRDASTKHAREVKDEIASGRFGETPDAQRLRHDDASRRAELLRRAREVDPQTTAAQIYDADHQWLFSK